MNKRLLFILIFGLELLIFGLDYITTPELPPFTIFYLAPIILAAFFLNSRQAYLMSLLAVVEEILVYQLTLPDFALFLTVFDVFSKSVIFFTVTFLVCRTRQQLDYLEQLARVDDLTKASTRRYFYEMSNAEIAQAFRYKYPITIVFLDLDDFKQVNDRFGHEKGDQLLAWTAGAIRADLREGDLIGRLGGDEFAILLHHADQDHARRVIERIRKKLTAGRALFNIEVTCSIGAVTYLSDKLTDIDELVRLADSAMYSVKVSTKNSVQYLSV